MAQGVYAIWPTNEVGEPLGNPPRQGQPGEAPDPTDENATNITFGIEDSAPRPLPKEQLELQQEIDEVLHTVRDLYLEQTDGSDVMRPKPQFRTFYVRLFYLAQLGLEGSNISPEAARISLEGVKSDLIDAEAGRVKNEQLRRRGVTALMLAIPFIGLYLMMRLTPANSGLANLLHSIGIERLVLANFMLLWVGCFVGVWLSYGIRTTDFSIDDLTITDSDRLQPVIRMLFAGTLTMILGIALTLGIVQLSVGSFALTDFAASPMLAFLLGAFCGISERLLPNTVARQASDFISKAK